MPILKKQTVDQDVWSLALDRVRYIYDMFDHVAVSFSGGKDSTVVLHACLEVAHERDRLPLHVVHWDEEAIPYEVEDYIRRVSQRDDVNLDWLCIPIKHTNACSLESDYWVTWNPDERDLWVRPMPPEGITEVEGYDPARQVYSIPEMAGVLFPPEKYGRVCMMLGLRAAESLTRYQAVSQRTEENFIVRGYLGTRFGEMALGYGNFHKGYPIYDWQTSDVWTAPHKFGWDYCQAYDLMEMAGITHHDQRVAPPFGTQPAKGLWMYSVCFPDLWERMVGRVPGARTAARWINSDLYNVSAIVKPDNISWADFIKQTIQAYDDPALQKPVGHVIRKYIRTHNKKTNNSPIHESVPHPDTGVTWKLLAQVALRKDNKSRINPSAKMASSNYDQALQRYNHAIAAERMNLSEEGTRF